MSTTRPSCGLADRLVADRARRTAAWRGTGDHRRSWPGRGRRPHRRAQRRRCCAWSPHQSGEGRFRWLHARRGAAAELSRPPPTSSAHLAWVVSDGADDRRRLVRPGVAAPVAARLGDVALVAREPVSYYDAADTGPFELVCRHGSLTSAEVLRAAAGGHRRVMAMVITRRARRYGRRHERRRTRHETDTAIDADGRGTVEHGELVDPPAGERRAEECRDRDRAGQGDAHRVDGEAAAGGGPSAPLDEASRERLAEIYERSVIELAQALSPDLQEELRCWPCRSTTARSPPR